MKLEDFFAAHPRVALAFSGGADSSYLLYAALKYGADVMVCYVRSPLQPAFEFNDAKRLAEELGADLHIIELNVLEDKEICSNPPDRCYYCKRRIMSAVREQAELEGFSEIIDGSNLSDDSGDRPGMRVLKEMGILSPLRLCSLTKPEIRALSKEAGLFTWNKPAYACLATRIPAGEVISAEKLSKAEQSEDILFKMGFTDFRVRLRGENALLQFTAGDTAAAKEHMDEIKARLGGLFGEIQLDPRERKESI